MSTKILVLGLILGASYSTQAMLKPYMREENGKFVFPYMQMELVQGYGPVFQPLNREVAFDTPNVEYVTLGKVHNGEGVIAQYFMPVEIQNANPENR